MRALVLVTGFILLAAAQPAAVRDARAKELDEKFPGVSRIVEIWFESYKGRGVLAAHGFDGPDAGMKLVEAAAAAFAD
jgi:hypothetical protein